MPSITIFALRVLCLAYLALLTVWWGARPAAAQTTDLPTAYREVNVGAGCTFADALQQTLNNNGNGCTITTRGTPAGKVVVIRLPAGTHQLPAITPASPYSLYLVGASRDNTVIVPTDATSRFIIDPDGTLNIRSTTWRGFGTPGGTVPEPINNAGGTLNISDSAFTDNHGNDAGVIRNAGTATIINSHFTASTSTFLGIIYTSGTMTIRNSVFANNVGLSEGVLENSGTLTISGSRFAGNSGTHTGTIFSNNSLTMTDSAVVDNRSESGIGGIHINGGSATINGNCIVGNGIALSSIIPINAKGNWWGSTTGPNGAGPGRGDHITINVDYINFRQSIPPVSNCPFLRGVANDDLFTLPVQVNEDFASPRSVLTNDIEVYDAKLAARPKFGTVQLNIDGNFTYRLTDPNNAEKFDYFTYQALTADGSLTVIAAVCIGLGDLHVIAPPERQTNQGVPVPIPGVSIESNTISEDTEVKVTLRVSDGILNVMGNLTNQPLDPIQQRCEDLITQPPVVAAVFDSLHTVDFRESSSASRLQQKGGEVGANGNGTATLTLSGNRADVNVVLDSLVYTPNGSFSGVDNLVIVANQSGIIARNSVRIVVLGGEQVAVNTPGGLVTLNDLCADPLSIICADVPPNTVTNGDVFVRIIAGYGEFLTNANEIGDGTLLDMGLIHSAEVFGMSFGGVPVASYNNTIMVCLRGSGNFYYRDATGIPRTTQQLPTTQRGEFTCAQVPNSGTVVLVTGGTNLVAATQAPSEQPLAGCMVTLTNRLNLREQPAANSAVIRLMPFDVKLTAVARQGEWFYVDYLGTFGWASGQYLRREGNCGG